ncbi:hypothetical protein RFI_01173, partial [Reticulomyxa filosa]
LLQKFQNSLFYKNNRFFVSTTFKFVPKKKSYLKKNSSNMSTQVNNYFQNLPEVPESFAERMIFHSLLKNCFLINHQSRFNYNIDVKNISKDFEEISKKQKPIQQEIYEKYLEKVKLKNEMDKAILNFTKCIEQYNNLCSKERDILIEKQKKKQKLNTINQDY